MHQRLGGHHKQRPLRRCLLREFAELTAGLHVCSGGLRNLGLAKLHYLTVRAFTSIEPEIRLNSILPLYRPGEWSHEGLGPQIW